MAFDVYTWYELSMQFTIQYIYGVEHYFSLFSQGIQSLLVGREEILRALSEKVDTLEGEIGSE